MGIKLENLYHRYKIQLCSVVINAEQMFVSMAVKKSQKLPKNRMKERVNNMSEKVVDVGLALSCIFALLKMIKITDWEIGFICLPFVVSVILSLIIDWRDRK